MENKTFDFHEIKTFEDACERLGISENTQLLVVDPGDTEAFFASGSTLRVVYHSKGYQQWQCTRQGFVGVLSCLEILFCRRFRAYV